MATKDLNLSLDRALLQSNVAREHQAANGETRAATAPAGRRQAGKKRTAKHAPQRTAAWPAIAFTGIAIANMSFLVLAGLWLSAFSGLQPAAAGSADVEISAQLDRIDRSISALQQQLTDLQVAANAQQQLIVSAYQSIGDQLQVRTDPSAATKQAGPGAGDSATTPAAADNPEASADWYVDLGNFPSRNAALAAQRSLLALGYEARIQVSGRGGSSAHALILADFKDRPSAESVATALMEQTQLESVSVWKQE